MTLAPVKHVSLFEEIPAAPPDPIIGLTEMFDADTRSGRVNLGVGVYQSEEGKVPMLAAVKEAERRLQARNESGGYLPITGLPAFTAQAQSLLVGSDAGEKQRLAGAQAVGGTGALRVGADFLQRFFPGATVWLSDPSWENHKTLFEAAGFPVRSYPYYNPQTHGLEFDAMLAALSSISAGDIVLLHACCHNPTGVDLDEEQWRQVAETLTKRGAVAFLDFAYQGLGDGIYEDARAIRVLLKTGAPFLVAQSFSKSFSLYRERVGCLTVAAGSESEAKRVAGQLKRVIRANYSSPPSYGGRLVATVLSDDELRACWENELAAMRNRIKRMRESLVRGLAEAGAKEDFSFIIRQKGMFSYSGLKPEAVTRLREDYGIYIVGSGRICVAALNERNIEAVCRAIAGVLSS
ncbi:MAG TPA: amino acid aminotransferase [Chthonomonadales bacterium]|nr:amino acid aminotransferase [Chthonomonadales bacterium]